RFYLSTQADAGSHGSDHRSRMNLAALGAVMTALVLPLVAGGPPVDGASPRSGAATDIPPSRTVTVDPLVPVPVKTAPHVNEQGMAADGPWFVWTRVPSWPESFDCYAQRGSGAWVRVNPRGTVA